MCRTKESEVMSLESPITNFVMLSPGVEKILHFSDHKIEPRVITDPFTKQPKKVESLVFTVDQEDGRAVSRSYSILSQKHAAEFSGYLEGNRYRDYVFTIVKDAPGTVPPRIVSVRPK